MPGKKAKWKLVADYPVTGYQCGVRAGDRVRLRQDLIVRDHKGKPTGGVHHAGEIWSVITGATEPPVAVWLQQPDGHRHTWDDNATFWDWFEKLDTDAH